MRATAPEARPPTKPAGSEAAWKPAEPGAADETAAEALEETPARPREAEAEADAAAPEADELAALIIEPDDIEAEDETAEAPEEAAPTTAEAREVGTTSEAVLTPLPIVWYVTQLLVEGIAAGAVGVTSWPTV